MMVKKILFVCTGNTCRSVMAEGLLKKMLAERGVTDIIVKSAGIAASPFSRIYGVLEKVLREEGINVSEHRPTQVSAEMVDEADLVLVMEARHREAILELTPQAQGKVFLLKEFAGERENLDIPDPIGQPEHVYRMRLQEIKQYLSRILTRMLPEKAK